MLTNEGEPKSFEEFVGDDHQQKWIEAAQDEMTSWHENKTFELKKLSQGTRALKNKWVFRNKHEEL